MTETLEIVRSGLTTQTAATTRMIDADGHIMEPPNLWRDYLPRREREGCLTVRRDPLDGDKLVVNGVPSRLLRRLGGIQPGIEGAKDWNSLELNHYEPYLECCYPGSYLPKPRLAWMDQQGIDVSLLFPSIGLIWPRQPGLPLDYIDRHFRAYNRWIEEFCSQDRSRLFPVAQTTLHDVDAAIAEIEDLASRGFRAIMLPHKPRSDGTPFQAAHLRFWQAVADCQLLVCLHKASIPLQLDLSNDVLAGIAGNGAFFRHVNEILPGQQNLASLFDGGLPAAVPQLRFAFLECNAGWLPSWLDRADESFEVLEKRGDAPSPCPPRDYIETGDRFFFNAATNENLELLSGFANTIVLASDFPHPCAPVAPVAAWRAAVAKLDHGQQNAMLGDNAARMLRI